MILGIMGKISAGKDTTADILVRDHGFVKVALADELKRFLYTLGFPYASLWGPSEERSKIIPKFGKPSRDALVPLGTEWGRAFFLDLWVDRVFEIVRKVQEGYSYFQVAGLADDVERQHPAGRSIVIPDCRFRNEFDAVKRIGGKMVRVVRPGTNAGTHASETEQDTIADHEFDHIVTNSGTISDLEIDLIEWLRVQNGGGE